jgi:hypothetical protein
MPRVIVARSQQRQPLGFPVTYTPPRLCGTTFCSTPYPAIVHPVADDVVSGLGTLEATNCVEAML